MTSEQTVPWGWIITEDHIDAGTEGIWGPRETKYTPDEIRDRGEIFELYDDDGEKNVTGRLLIDYDAAEQYEYADPEFSPLDDYGYGGLGCTSIKLRNPNTGRMETL